MNVRYTIHWKTNQDYFFSEKSDNVDYLIMMRMNSGKKNHNLNTHPHTDPHTQRDLCVSENELIKCFLFEMNWN